MLEYNVWVKQMVIADESMVSGYLREDGELTQDQEEAGCFDGIDRACDAVKTCERDGIVVVHAKISVA